MSQSHHTILHANVEAIRINHSQLARQLPANFNMPKNTSHDWLVLLNFMLRFLASFQGLPPIPPGLGFTIIHCEYAATRAFDCNKACSVFLFVAILPCTQIQRFQVCTPPVTYKELCLIQGNPQRNYSHPEIVHNVHLSTSGSSPQLSFQRYLSVLSTRKFLKPKELILLHFYTYRFSIMGSTRQGKKYCSYDGYMVQIS